MATTVKPIKRVVGSFSDNPTFDELGHRLAEIAATWRSTKASDLVERYNAILLSLIELGYNEALDIELCLPDEFMSFEYRQKHWQKRMPTPQP
jgi:hypothetical protein